MIGTGATLAALLLLTVAALEARRRLLAASGELQQADPLDLGAIIANVGEEVRQGIAPEEVPIGVAERNVAAFLRMIRYAEGTAGSNGYRTMFGGDLFDSYADHPRRAVQFTDRAGRRLWTSAAGAYQFMAVSPLPTGGSTRVDTWDRIKRRLALPDFSPASQDAAAVALIDEAGGLADVRAGRFADAVFKVRKVWASLPGAGYAQPEKSLAALQTVYMESGGIVA